MTDQSTTERIAELKKLAEASGDSLRSREKFKSVCTPQFILSLIGHIAELERKNAKLEKKLATALTAVKDAYFEGFFAMETYNDAQLNDEDEAFKASEAAQFIASHQKEDKA